MRLVTVLGASVRVPAPAQQWNLIVASSWSYFKVLLVLTFGLTAQWFLVVYDTCAICKMIHKKKVIAVIYAQLAQFWLLANL